MVHLRKVEKSVYVLPLKSKGNVSTFQDLNNLGEAIPPILPVSLLLYSNNILFLMSDIFFFFYF